MAKRQNSNGLEEAKSGDALWLPADPTVVDGKPPTNALPPAMPDAQDRLDEPRPSGLEVFDVAPGRLQKLRFRAGLLLDKPTAAVRLALLQEREKGAAFLWSPVVFGLGCILYFSLPREPLALAFPLLALASWIFSRRIGVARRVGTLLAALAIFALGVTAAQVKTWSLSTVMLERTVVATLSGQVIRAENRANGSTRYTIDISVDGARFEARGVELMPERLRLTARKDGPLARVGDRISGRARVGPSSGPAFPGAYDFSFMSWFDGVGGSGFFLGAPTVSKSVGAFAASPSLWISSTREAVSTIVRDALPGTAGGLAAALIVGDRSGIDDDTAEALRRSGLAHILAISGLHMALVAMTVIFVLRGLLACFPAVSLHYPVRKSASLIALVAATIYLALSGGNVSTQRAYIMVAIMLVAVLLDRRALTMRNVALAALVVLAIAPQAVLTPGFQMSFAAVAALVATYEAVSARRQPVPYKPGLLRYGQRFLTKDIGGLALTSLVAGLATGLFAAFHFYRVAPFGLVANLLAMPLVSFFVMPSALLSVIAMPFGLESYPLSFMAYFMEKVVSIASLVSEWEPQGNTGLVPVGVLGFATLALLIATLSRSWLKVLALPVLAVAVFGLFQPQRPDVLILENGRQLGVFQEDGSLTLLRPNADKFSTAIWRKALTPSALEPERAARGKAGAGYRCDDTGCSIEVKGAIITHLKSTSRLHEDCQIADVIVVRNALVNACGHIERGERPLVLDAEALRKGGSHSLSIGNIKENGRPSIAINTAHDRPNRPWSQHRQ